MFTSCLIRKEKKQTLPEEIVRQRFIAYIIQEKGFKRALIAVEKSLKLLPHLSLIEKKAVPDRRADILCYAKDIHDVRPLLLIECKAKKITQTAIAQVIGYNYYVKADFIAVVNQEEVRFGFYDSTARDYAFIDYLPTFEQLLL